MNKLKELRTRKGLTQDQIAEMLNIPMRTYAGYERGERDLSTEMLQTMASFFGVTTDCLLGRDKTSLDPDETIRFALFGDPKADITDEEFAEVKRFAAFVREKRKHDKR